MNRACAEIIYKLKRSPEGDRERIVREVCSAHRLDKTESSNLFYRYVVRYYLT